jgi:uncharacterized membrane protein YqiK
VVSECLDRIRGQDDARLKRIIKEATDMRNEKNSNKKRRREEKEREKKREKEQEQEELVAKWRIERQTKLDKDGKFFF